MTLNRKFVKLLVCKIITFASLVVSLPIFAQSPVDYVNPYMGGISHLLVPTFPTMHMPGGMLRVYPERGDFTGERVSGLPIAVTSHRGSSAFNLSPMQGEIGSVEAVGSYTYDNEKITPYGYSVVLDEAQTKVDYALSYQSGIYNLTFTQDSPVHISLNSRNGEIAVDGKGFSGYQNLINNTRIYLYLEPSKEATQVGAIKNGNYHKDVTRAKGKQAALVMSMGSGEQSIQLRYGISFISTEQAKKNLYREQDNAFALAELREQGRKVWNDALGKIDIKGDTDEMGIFYTSLYRCYERPVCISEDGRYFSAFDGKVHSDNGTPFYTDDWIWDTYRATHPLRLLIEEKLESDVINSFLLMAQQMGNDWMPTFPEITGDSRRMNSNHAVATVADAYNKGMRTFDLEYAYLAAKKGIEEKTLAPWSGRPAGWLDEFYKKNGYIPAIDMGQKETVPEVSAFEKRQPVAVTLGTAYDQWCLSQIASALGKEQEAEHYLKMSYNYRNLYNKETKFFHPKDSSGKFIEPFDYSFPGGMGAREFYGENNGWVYRYDVPHNVPDLVDMMGGSESFDESLDQMYSTSLGRSKFEFYAKLPDHTGNVGQFSMANEPSLHIPYLYNYVGKPWKSQKRVRTLMRQWFRNDLMGVPGDEDGGGMSAFVVFTMMGFYPVTPGLPVYAIGTPFFPYAKINLSNGNSFVIEAKGASYDNKYIQSATLNGKPFNSPFISHQDIAQGGKLVFVMGETPNYEWGVEATKLQIAAQ